MKEEFKEYSLNDLFDVILKYKSTLAKFSIFCVLVTIIYVLVVPPLYLSKAKVLTNTGNTNSVGKISSLASQFGVNLGDSQNAGADFSPEVYIEILNSRKLFDELTSLSFNIKNNDDNSLSEITLFEYLIDKSSDDFKEKDKEYAFEEFYDSVIKSSKNLDSSSITIEVRTTNKDFSYQLLKSIVSILNKIQLDFKTEKIKSKKEFILKQIESTSLDLEVVEDEWISVQKSNISPKSPALILKEEKLKREVVILTNVYTNLKNELEIAKIEEVEQNKSVDVIDPPNYPVLKDWPKRKNMVIQSFVLSIILGISIILMVEYFSSKSKKEEI